MLKIILLSDALSLKLRLKFFNAVVTPTAIYSLHTEALTQSHRQRVASTRFQMLRRIVGFSKFPGESWEMAGSRCKQKTRKALDYFTVPDWLHSIDKAKWRLTAKISEQRSAWPYAVMTWMPPAKQRVGRPKVRWTDSVNDFLLAVRGESLIQCLRHPHSNFWKEQEKAFIQHAADTV